MKSFLYFFAEVHVEAILLNHNYLTQFTKYVYVIILRRAKIIKDCQYGIMYKKDVMIDLQNKQEKEKNCWELGR